MGRRGRIFRFSSPIHRRYFELWTHDVNRLNSRICSLANRHMSRTIGFKEYEVERSNCIERGKRLYGSEVGESRVLADEERAVRAAG